jgi:hypothetical protein
MSPIKRVIRAKDYKAVSFRTNEDDRETLYEKRNKWLGDNPNAIIFNTHVLFVDNKYTHIIEYVDN